MNAKEWDQYAENYHQTIISPFQKNVQNPLFDDLKRIPNKMQNAVADIGTGTGPLLLTLAAQFNQVHAIDFSTKMLQKAQAKTAAYSNISFHQCDITKLKSLDLQVNVAIAVNSLLIPNLQEVDISLQEVHSSLTENGIFLGIFPSMESVLYNSMLVYERELKKCGDQKKALTQARKIAERKKYNFILGLYEDNEEAQKFYYRFELLYRLKKAGFKQIKVKKVLYPWGSSDYEDFPGKPKMWDWYVSALS